MIVEIPVFFNNLCIGLYKLSSKKAVTIDDQTSNKCCHQMKLMKKSHHVCNMIRNVYSNTISIIILNMTMIRYIMKHQIVDFEY